MTRVVLLPQRLILVSSWKSHCCRVSGRILREQALDILDESVGRIDAVEPVGDIAQMGIELVGCYLSVGYPLIWQAIREVGLNHDVGIPKRAWWAQMLRTTVMQRSQLRIYSNLGIMKLRLTDFLAALSFMLA